MTVTHNHTFPDTGTALAFVKEHGGAWVVKQNDHQSHLNYVGVMPDGSDVIGVLANYLGFGIKNLTLQRKLSGVEIGVARYFNGNDWVGPIEVSQEHKALMNGEVGPKTGEMGTLMWFMEDSRLFDATLGRLKGYLTQVDFRGNIAINCFVDGNAVRPIEATARFGCPSTHLQTALHLTPWTDLLCALADKSPCDLQVRDGFGVVLTLAVPPFPYDVELLDGFSSVGMPLLLLSPLTADEGRRLHFEGVARERDHKDKRIALTRSLGWVAFASGTGVTVELAQRAAYDLTRKLVIPKMMYRTDIGDRFLAGDREKLRQFGWI
jgi:phosphoribosylamine--glycine ligase